MPNYVKAEQGLNHSVIYTDNLGNRYRFSGGTWAWRNHNPGNVAPGSVSKRNRQIGKAGGFAVFPDYQSGHAALLDSLSTTFFKMSLNKLVYQYAPPYENDTEAYRKFLCKKVGVTGETKVKELSTIQFEKLWRAIEQMEGSKTGTITKVYEVMQVHKSKKGSIESYNVEEIGWISKEKCIQMTKLGKLELVVCISHSGAIYVRTKPDNSIKDNLSSKAV